MKRLFLIILIFSLSAVFVSALADGQQGPLINADKAQKVRITTVDPNTGKRVGNVTLQLYDRDGNKVMSVRTNGNGVKTVSLKPGKYQAGIKKAPKGYAAGIKIVTVHVKKGRDTAWTLQVPPQITCKFKVLDCKGDPVPGATVHISLGHATTNGKGIATLRKVAYGSYQVSVSIINEGRCYVACRRMCNLKAGAGETVSKTIRLPDPAEWTVPVAVIKKPVIYLYSKEEKNVSVRLGHPENITAAYPAYPEEGWSVTVHPGGRLTDKASGRELYSLYWEGKTGEKSIRDNGFVVEGKDTASFLEAKLAVLGLSEREAEEFIIYWLPMMQGNAWNFIRFVPEEEINGSMPLLITPAVERTLRVWMEYTPLKTKLRGIKEQELTPVNRNELNELGFYAVEWGGMEF